jgi:hypothetical protein
LSGIQLRTARNLHAGRTVAAGGFVMITDSVLQEVREIRDAYAKQFNYDLKAIHCDLKLQEQAEGRKIVSLPPRRPDPALLEKIAACKKQNQAPVSIP